ncbi:MAG: fasciclin domain-containing protein [Actinomycetota bacterium]
MQSTQRYLRLAAGVIAIGLFATACSDDKKSTSTTAAPTTKPMAAEMDIVDTAVAAGNFTVLAEALKAAGLVDALKAAGPFTVFAPTDEAFAAALKALGMTKEALLADKALLTKVLTYHVIEGKVLAADAIALAGKSAATLNGAKIAITVVDGKVKLNADTTVVKADIMASNGVIHVIDKVLLPPAA